MTSAHLPRTVEQLTPQWLTEALQERCPGIVVTGMKTDLIMWGTATKVLVDAQYGGKYEPYGIPNKLCIKGEFDEKLRQQLAGVSMTGTQIEAAFYNDIAPKLGVPLARHWYAGSEPGMGILILDNMIAGGYTFGTPTQAWSPDLVGKSIDILARLHASTWGKSFADVTWLQIGSPAVQGYTEVLMSEAHWKEQLARPGAYQLIPYTRDRERAMRALRALWRYDETHSHCLVHGDAHLGNMCVDPSGQPFFIDWAGPSICNWAMDVAYFVAGALSVEDRRATEKDLFDRYLKQLAINGGPTLERKEAWDDFGRHLVNGQNWCVLPPSMHPSENVYAMGERYSAAMADHDTYTLLGV